MIHIIDYTFPISGDPLSDILWSHLWRDDTFSLKAVALFGKALKFVEKPLPASLTGPLCGRPCTWTYSTVYKDIVLTAVRQNGMALQFASQSALADEQIVLAAVSQAGCALQNAAPSLCNDRRIVFAAALQNANALKFAGPRMELDCKLVRAGTGLFSAALQL